MSFAYNILPECFIDTNIVNTLMKEAGIYDSANHCHGCNKVGDMMKNKFKDEFALGIIDNDKKQHSYNSEFNIIGKTEHLELLKHKSKHQYLIKVSPAMDGFILDVANRNNISMADYELPEKLKEFTIITKDIKAKDSINLKKLFQNLLVDKEIILLKELLEYIYNNMYNCDKDILCSFFSK